MIENLYPGKFIVLEGIDFAGKSTQVERLTRYLRAYHQKLKFIITKEPTQEYYGKKIRNILNDQDIFDKISSSSLQTLYAVDSKEHMSKVVIPALERGELVISDRWRTSSIAYGANDLKEISDYYFLNQFILEESFIWPDLIILINISLDTSMERQKKSSRESDALEELKKLKITRDNYLLLSKEKPNIQVIDGDRSEEEVFVDVRDFIKEVV